MTKIKKKSNGISPKNGIRFAASTIDFTIYFLLIILSLVFIGPYFVNRIVPYKENVETMQKYAISSGLYILDTDKFETKKEQVNFYQKSIKYFYTVYENQNFKEEDLDLKRNLIINPRPYNYIIDDKDYTNYWFNIHILGLNDDLNLYDNEINNGGNELFEYINENIESKNKIARIKSNYLNTSGEIDDTYLSTFQEFYKARYQEAYDKLTNMDYYSSLLKENVFAEKLEYITFLSIPFLIFYIIIPIFLPFRKSIGRLIMKIGLIDEKHKTELNIGFYLLRELPFILLLVINYFLNSIITFILCLFVLFLANLISVLFNPTKRGVFEYISNSNYADLRMDSDGVIKNEKEK